MDTSSQPSAVERLKVDVVLVASNRMAETCDRHPATGVMLRKSVRDPNAQRSLDKGHHTVWFRFNSEHSTVAADLPASTIHHQKNVMPRGRTVTLRYFVFHLLFNKPLKCVALATGHVHEAGNIRCHN